MSGRAPIAPMGNPGAHELPVLCRKLRSKGAPEEDSEGASWLLGRSTTAAYWCLSTMEPFGPDDAFCHPHVCGEGRTCFQPPDDAEPARQPPRIA